MSGVRRRPRTGRPTVTASDRETADQLIAAIKAEDVGAVARILAFVREQAVSVAVVAAERERGRAGTEHAEWCRTDGCDGSCREVERLDDAREREKQQMESAIVSAIEILRERSRERGCDHCKRAWSTLEASIESGTRKKGRLATSRGRREG